MKFSLTFFSCIVLCAASTNAAVLAAHWKLDEGSGTSAGDETANNRDGTLSGGVGWTTTGLAPVPSGTTAALQFDGLDDQLDVVGYQGVTGTAGRSMAAWIRTSIDDPNQDMAIMSWGNNSAGQKWTFRVQQGNGTAGALRIEVNGGYHVGSTVIADGEWHHVAVTLNDDGSPDVSETLLYVDGMLETTSDVLGQAINTSSLNDVRLGIDFVGRRWNGDLDDVRIYEGVLTPQEVAALAIIPEPSAMLLGAFAATGLLLRRRRN